MSYEILNKTYVRIDGQITETKVDLRKNDPYTLLNRSVDGDHTNTSDDKLIKIVLQMVNDETTPRSELVRNIKDLRKQVEDQQELIAKSVESNQVLSGAFEELSFMVIEQVLPQLEEKEAIDAIPIEDNAQPTDEGVGE